MYVVTEFLMGLAKQDDWLQDAALDALEEYDAIYAGIAIVSDESVLTTEQDYDAIELDRVPLDEFGS